MMMSDIPEVHVTEIGTCKRKIWFRMKWEGIKDSIKDTLNYILDMSPLMAPPPIEMPVGVYPPAKDNAYAIRGTALHYLIQHYLQKTFTPQGLEEFFKSLNIPGGAYDLLTEEVDKSYQRAVPWLDENIDMAGTDHIEEQIIKNYSTFNLVGTPDLVCYNVINDWKSGKKPWSNTLRKYKQQVAVYDWLLGGGHDALIVCFGQDPPAEISVENKEMAVIVVDKVIPWLRQLEEELPELLKVDDFMDVPFHFNGDNCLFCDFKHHCRMLGVKA